MIKHHPDARLLNEFAAGSLSLAQSLCVAAHLNYCETCRRHHKQLQQLASAMFENLAPQTVDNSTLAAVLNRLDEKSPLSHQSSDSLVEGEDYPALIQRLIHGDFQDLPWKRINSKLKISRLRTGDRENEAALYHIRAGGSIPEHTHKGNELTLVLEGSFSDEEGVYQQGDFLMRDSGHKHTPTAAKTGDCVCLGVLDASIEFTGWNYRLLNPFLRLNAQ